MTAHEVGADNVLGIRVPGAELRGTGNSANLLVAFHPTRVPIPTAGGFQLPQTVSASSPNRLAPQTATYSRPLQLRKVDGIQHPRNL